MSTIFLNVRRTERPKTCNHTTCPPPQTAGFCSCPTAEAMLRLGKNRFYGRLSAVPVNMPTTKEETLRTLKCFFGASRAEALVGGSTPSTPTPSTVDSRGAAPALPPPPVSLASDLGCSGGSHGCGFNA